MHNCLFIICAYALLMLMKKRVAHTVLGRFWYKWLPKVSHHTKRTFRKSSLHAPRRQSITDDTHQQKNVNESN